MRKEFEKYFKYRYRIVGVMLEFLINLILFPFRKIVFKSISFSSNISIRSSIRNYNLIEIGRYSVISPLVVLWPTKLIIGNYVQLNPGTTIYGSVIIEDYVMIGPNCMIAGGNHNINRLDVPIRFQGSNEKGILIEKDVWIGSNCVILDGVKIGKSSVIGAGSLVNKDIPDCSIVVGNPCRIIKKRKYNE